MLLNIVDSVTVNRSPIDILIDSDLEIFLPNLDVLNCYYCVLSYHMKNTFDAQIVQAVDYEATLSAKISIAKKIFALEKDELFQSGSFQRFFSENKV